VPESVLLDTNVAIYHATDHSLGVRYRALVDRRRQVLSFASAAELMYTGFRAREPKKVARFWRAWFPVHTVLLPDLETCEIWARIAADCHRRGRPREHNDLWIAATALRHDLPLVTHNRRHFDDIPDLTVISEAPETH
jgi:tRNA(fMet)-specific endonuclease VapC